MPGVRGTRIALSTAAALVSTFVAACSPSTAPTAPTTPTTPANPSGNSAKQLVTGLTTPWEVLALDDGSLLVSERDTKKIRRVQGSSVTDLITVDAAQPSGEGGLLGLALSPQRDTLFAYLTAATDNRIVAMSFDGSKLGTPRVVLAGIPKGGRHNGGRMVVGPDGLLYVGTGETGQPALAQDKNSLAGKILRLTLDGRPAPDNPYGNEVWSYGHRNVEGLAFDADGRLWASEFGEQTSDELNLITRGANYGWPTVEGTGGGAGFTDPEITWRTDEASPSGLAFADGSLWMAALRGARLWQIPLSAGQPGTPRAHLQDQLGRIRTATPVGHDLLVVTSNTDGRGDVRDGDDRIVRMPLG